MAIDFKIVDAPVKVAKVVENEYTPLVDELIALGFDSGKESQATFPDADTADVVKAKFSAAARGRGVTPWVKKRGEDGKKVTYGFAVKEKITRPRKALETEAE